MVKNHNILILCTYIRIKNSYFLSILGYLNHHPNFYLDDGLKGHSRLGNNSDNKYKITYNFIFTVNVKIRILR
jgi:hypothetical protein